MDVVCSRCQFTIVATIPDEAAAPAGGLGICGPCGDIVNAERLAARVTEMTTQVGTYEPLATIQGLSLAGLPTGHAALKGLLGL